MLCSSALVLAVMQGGAVSCCILQHTAACDAAFYAELPVPAWLVGVLVT